MCFALWKNEQSLWKATSWTLARLLLLICTDVLVGTYIHNVTIKWLASLDDQLFFRCWMNLGYIWILKKSYHIFKYDYDLTYIFHLSILILPIFFNYFYILLLLLYFYLYFMLLFFLFIFYTLLTDEFFGQWFGSGVRFTLS